MAYVTRVGTGAGRPIADKYARRIKKVYGVTKQIREMARVDYLNGLKAATQLQLYDRTPLKVTHDMMNSIGAIVKKDEVIVGYNVGSPSRKASYAVYRVNMKGVSKLGGHVLNMQPNTYLRNRVDPKVRRRNAKGAKAILEA